MTASAANIRPVLPAAVIRSAPFLLVDEEVGFRLLELPVADCADWAVSCAAVCAVVCATVFAGVLWEERKESKVMSKAPKDKRTQRLLY